MKKTIIAIAVLVLAGAVYYYARTGLSSRSPDATPAAAATKTYSHSKFSFGYPATAAINDKDCCDGIMATASVLVYPAGQSPDSPDAKYVMVRLYERASDAELYKGMTENAGPNDKVNSASGLFAQIVANGDEASVASLLRQVSESFRFVK